MEEPYIITVAITGSLPDRRPATAAEARRILSL